MAVPLHQIRPPFSAKPGPRPFAWARWKNRHNGTWMSRFCRVNRLYSANRIENRDKFVPFYRPPIFVACRNLKAAPTRHQMLRPDATLVGVC